MRHGDVVWAVTGYREEVCRSARALASSRCCCFRKRAEGSAAVAHSPQTASPVNQSESAVGVVGLPHALIALLTRIRSFASSSLCRTHFHRLAFAAHPPITHDQTGPSGCHSARGGSATTGSRHSQRAHQDIQGARATPKPRSALQPTCS